VLAAIAPYLAAQLTVSLKPQPEAKVVTSTGDRVPTGTDIGGK